MKTIKLFTFLLTVTLCGCMGEFGPEIEQWVGKDAWCDGEKRFYTAVWYDGKIVWSRADNMGTLNDSIVSSAYNKAAVVKTALSNMK